MKNFWEKLKKPIFCLAPMHEVSDTAFRQTVIHYGKPDVIFTEFVSVDALCSEQSRKKITDFFLRYDKKIERPIIAQLWGNDPKKFEKVASYVKSLGFDGIDINMGCPTKNVVKIGGGSALIQNPALAVKIIKATKKGAGELPVSVKTRIGFNVIETEEWIKNIVKAKPDAIIVHGRTRKEMSRVPTHWEEIKKAAEIIKGAKIIAIGNGDIKDLADAREKARIFNLDGIMVGRAVLENPWFFNPNVDYKTITAKQKIEALIFHAKIFEKEFSGVKKFYRFRKMISAYISGFNGAKEFRIKLMDAENTLQIQTITNDFLNKI